MSQSVIDVNTVGGKALLEQVRQKAYEAVVGIREQFDAHQLTAVEAMDQIRAMHRDMPRRGAIEGLDFNRLTSEAADPRSEIAHSINLDVPTYYQIGWLKSKAFEERVAAVIAGHGNAGTKTTALQALLKTGRDEDLAPRLIDTFYIAAVENAIAALPANSEHVSEERHVKEHQLQAVLA